MDIKTIGLSRSGNRLNQKNITSNSTPLKLNNITLNYTPAPKQVILISELIYAYKSCESTLFRVPNWNTKGNCISNFRYVLKILGMTEDMDTRYLGGRHPKSGLVIPKHYLQVHPEGNERMRSAKSLFSKGMVDWYDQQGIETCHMANWTSLVVKSTPIQAFVPTNEINNIIAVCEEKRFEHPEFYKAYLLAYGLGLRNSEMRRAKWSDLYQDMDGNCLIRIHNPKSGGLFQDRPCDPHFWKKIMDLRNFHDKILQASEKVIREGFSQFLKKECGVKERRAVHLLRKYCGHRVMRGNDIYSASKALGHSDTKITDQIYSGLPTIRATKVG